MRVAIDSGPLSGGHSIRGVGVYARELIKALEKEKDKDVEISAFDFSKDKSLLGTQSFDVIHFTYFHPHFLTLPLSKSTKLVVTIHDLIQLIYPKYYQPGLKGSLKFLLQKYLIKKADSIISVSETTKKDIVRFLGVPSDKINVVYEAPRSIFKPIPDRLQLSEIKKKYSLPSKFVLYVGDINYNKNIPTLIKACMIAGLPLVICGKQALEVDNLGSDLKNLAGPRDYLRYLLGKPHPELAHFSELNNEFKNNSKVLRLGFVEDKDLVAIYNLAGVYCQPSYYEGFGLPVLEAMACEVPVVIARTQALTEISSNAALVTDSKNPEDMAEKIISLMNNSSLRLGLVRKADKIVKNFTWEKTAKQTLEIYKMLVSHP